jgi:hypothetical protein
MEMFLGILGSIQAVFLPGFLVVFARDRGLSRTFRVVLIFGLSLVINYFLVMLLVIVHWYTQRTLLVIFCLETAALGLCLKNYFASPKKPPAPAAAAIPASHLVFFIRTCYQIALAAAFCWAVSRLRNVFNSWDAVASWNRWACDIAGNILPRNTLNYPQLLPCVMSIPYTFMKNTEIWFFSYAVHLPFLFVTLAAGYSLIDEGEPLPALGMGVLAAVWFFGRAGGGARMTGYADFPVQSMGAYILCTMIMWENRQGDAEKEPFLRICLGALLAGAAVTKQAGLPLLAFFPFMALERSSGAAAAPVFRRRLWALLAGIVIAVAPWYLYVRAKIALGLDSSEVSWVMGGIHEGRGPLARLISAMRSHPFIFWWAGAALPALRVKRCRLTALFGVLYVFMWAFLLSYDIRNVSFAVPFLGFAAGAWLSAYGEKLVSIFRAVINVYVSRERKITGILGVLVLIAGAAGFLSFNDRLIQYNIKKRMHAGLGIEMNTAILETIRENPSAVIVTDYQPVFFLPGIQQSSFHSISDYKPEFEEQLLPALTSSPNSYFLARNPFQKEWVYRLMRQGRLIPVMLYEDLGLYKYVDGPGQTSADN